MKGFNGYIKYLVISMIFIAGFFLIKNYKNLKILTKYKQHETIGFSGKMENGLKSGEWRDYFINGNLAEIKNYKNDTLNSIRIKYTPNGEYALIEKYKMGIKVDTSKMYSGGKLNEIVYRDSLGRLQGEFRVYVKDKISQIGHYLDNEFHGDFISYDYKTGIVKETYTYHLGKKKGRWIYFKENGDTLKIENY